MDSLIPVDLWRGYRVKVCTDIDIDFDSMFSMSKK